MKIDIRLISYFAFITCLSNASFAESPTLPPHTLTYFNLSTAVKTYDEKTGALYENAISRGFANEDTPICKASKAPITNGSCSITVELIQNFDMKNKNKSHRERGSTKALGSSGHIYVNEVKNIGGFMLSVAIADYPFRWVSRLPKSDEKATIVHEGSIKIPGYKDNVPFTSHFYLSQFCGKPGENLWCFKDGSTLSLGDIKGIQPMRNTWFFKK